MSDALHVLLDDTTLGERETVVGTLHCERRRGHEAIAFAYDDGYLCAPSPVEMDPELPLHAGRQYAPSGRLFGVLRDCSPDRWGRVLMERREALEATREGRRPRRLSEWDFLVGVDDTTRHGALRLRSLEEPAAYVDDRERSVPPFSRLREIEALTRELERDDVEEQPELARWLAQLVAPGSSLGGARPKSSFSAEDGSLWLAKFPSREDRYDVGAWERFASVLAGRAAIEMPECRLLRLGGRYRTFAARRFDRDGDARRHYASAMTLLGRDDGEGASYLDIAEAMQLHGAPDRLAHDLGRLYRRIVYSILIGNRDDHLRNHGFLRDPTGWVLCPAFDLNPNPDKAHHALAIDVADPTPSIAALRSTREYYRLTEEAAATIETQVREAVRAWPEVATAEGITKADQRQLATIIDPERA